MNALKRFFTYFIISISIVFVPACPEGSTQSVQWNSFNSGVSKAIKSKKPVIVDFYADWCHWCKVMEKETFRNKEVIDYLRKNFIAVRVDVEKKENITYMGMKITVDKLSSIFGVQGLPTIAFLDKEGKFIDKIPGFINAEIFIALLGYINDECYKKKISFSEYKDKKVKCK